MSANTLDAIVVLGDSLTQGGWQPGGFVQRLAYVYSRKLDVINRGLSGYNTEWALPVFDQIFVTQDLQSYSPKVKLLIIWFGANDSCLPMSPQHVPIPRFSDNLSSMIRKIRSPSSEFYSPTTRILLLTPPPIDITRRSSDLASRNPPVELDRAFDVTQSYTEAVINVGKQEGVRVVDIWQAIWQAAGRRESDLARFLNDGLHLSTEGYSIVYEEIIKVVLEFYPELHYDRLPLVFPHWSDVDWKNPKESLHSRRIDV